MTDFYKLNNQLKNIDEGYYEMPPIDRERYTDLEGEGLEGPFQTRSGKVVYYDPKEGKYYDRDSDMYLSHEEFQAYDQSKPDDYKITKMELPKRLKRTKSDLDYMSQMDDAHAQIYGEGKMSDIHQDAQENDKEDFIAMHKDSMSADEAGKMWDEVQKQMDEGKKKAKKKSDAEIDQNWLDAQNSMLDHEGKLKPEYTKMRDTMSEGIELTTSLQQAYESILKRENDSLANPEVVESQAETSELDEQQDSKDLQEEQVAPYDNSECSTDDEEEIVNEAPPLPTEKQKAMTQRIKDRIAMRSGSPEDTLDLEKESTAKMLKLVREISEHRRMLENMIIKLAELDNGDLHDQLSTMFDLNTKFSAVLRRAMSIVPRYESIKNEASFGEKPMEDRVEYLFQTCMKDIENIDKIFEQGAFLEMSVDKIGGDISWFKDVRNALDNAYQAMEESHMGAVAHSQMKEDDGYEKVQSKKENQLTDIKKLAGIKEDAPQTVDVKVINSGYGTEMGMKSAEIISQELNNNMQPVLKVRIEDLNMGDPVVAEFRSGSWVVDMD
jgi:hypothetical protein